MRHLLSVTDLDAGSATGLLDTADRLKQALLGQIGRASCRERV